MLCAHFFVVMNLFWLSRRMKRNARYHCNKHVVKMCTEAVQLLYTAWWMLEPSGAWRPSAPLNRAGEHGYRMTHMNNPLAIWVRSSRTNYLLCVEYALTVSAEYTKRYKKTHASQAHAEWLRDNLPPSLPDTPMTPIPLIIAQKPVPYARTKKQAVAAYRKFYAETKRDFLVYPDGQRPSWIRDDE